MADIFSSVERRRFKAHEAAEYLGISVSTFRAIAKKELPPINITENRQVWLIKDLDDFLNKKTGRPTLVNNSNPWDQIFACR